jgi:hypothetical protein
MADMIDLWGVFSNFLWILGLAVLLATWSYAHYEARLSHKKVGEKLDELTYALSLDGGLLLFCAGLAATEHRWWARLIWIGMGVAILVEGGWRIVAHRRASDDDAETQEDYPEASSSVSEHSDQAPVASRQIETGEEDDKTMA